MPVLYDDVQMDQWINSQEYKFFEIFYANTTVYGEKWVR